MFSTAKEKSTIGHITHRAFMKGLKLFKTISRLSEVGIKLQSPQRALKVLTCSRVDHLCSILNNCPHLIHSFKCIEGEGQFYV